MSSRPVADVRDDRPTVTALVAAMDAAWRHDRADALTYLDEADTHLGTGFHQSRESIVRARAAAEAADWVTCWGLAQQATNTLTWHMPLHASACPPMPTQTPGVPNEQASCAGCGTDLPRVANFCPACGEKVHP